MRIYDDIQKTVVYLGIPIAGEPTAIEAHATGFVVDCDGQLYIVTAAHVAEHLGDGGFAARLNDKDCAGRVVHIDHAHWWRHPQEDNVDVAVVEFDPPEWADVSPFIPKWFLTAFKRETKDIGAGDLAHIVGLYHFVPGTKKITPIVHTGHIAMMDDDELLDARDWRSATPKRLAMQGYLVEAQTLDGLSGAPVFVRRSISAKVHVPDIDPNPLGVWWTGSLWLLGLWHGAWFGEPEAGKGINRRGSVKVPVGMGVVVPAIKILEVLQHPGLVARRQQRKG